MKCFLKNGFYNIGKEKKWSSDLIKVLIIIRLKYNLVMGILFLFNPSKCVAIGHVKVTLFPS